MTPPPRLPLMLALLLSASFALGCGLLGGKPDDDDDDDDWDDWDDFGDDSGDDPDDSGRDDSGDSGGGDSGDSGGDSGDSGGGDSGDSGGGQETGVMQGFWYGYVSTRDGRTLDDGGLGLSYVGLHPGDEGTLCTAVVGWEHGGSGPPGCPGCTWSFSPDADGTGPSEGAYCDQLGLSDDAMAEEASAYTLPIGFAEDYVYAYEGRNGEQYEITLPKVVFLYSSSSGWFLFAFNYGDTEHIFGDETRLEILRPAFGKGGEYTYYMYDRY